MEFLHANGLMFGNYDEAAALSVGIEAATNDDMHVRIERFYEFVMGAIDLTEIEQSHLIRCAFCVEWLDACAAEKVSVLIDRHKEPLASSGEST